VCPAIGNPVSCEIRAVIHFLHAKIMTAAETHCELYMVYGQNVTSEGTVRQWCGMFEDGQTNVHNEEPSGWPSAVRDDLSECCPKFVKDGTSRFQNFYVNFHKCNVLFSTGLS
jgi:hypothetical protein